MRKERAIKRKKNRRLSANTREGALPLSPAIPVERLIFGRNPIAEIIKFEPKRIEKLLISENLDFDHVFSGLPRISQDKIRKLPLRELDSLCSGQLHQGVAARLQPQKNYSVEELIDLIVASDKKILVALDQIADPHNLGAILRAAECAGVCGVLVTERRSASITAVVRKSSSGASELIPIATVGNLDQALLKLKEAGFWLVGADIGERAKSIYEIDLPQPLCLVLGSEGTGLRDLTKRRCDFLVKIPLRGRIDSLNVSQAAAVLLFELMSKL